MGYWVKVLWDIMLLRASPRAVPYSVVMLLIFLLCNIGFKLVDLRAFNFSGLAVTLISFGWLTLFLTLCLSYTHKIDRFVQTYTAILGTLLIEEILLRALGLFLSLNLAEVVSWFFLVWGLSILSYIVSNTLEIRARYAVLLVLIFEAVRIGLWYLMAGMIS